MAAPTPGSIRLAVMGPDFAGKTFVLSQIAPSSVIENRGYVVSTGVVSATSADGSKFFVELVEIPCPSSPHPSSTDGGATADVLLRQTFAGAVILVDGLSDRAYTEAAKYTRLLLDYQRPLGNMDIPVLLLVNLARGGPEDFSAQLRKVTGLTSASLLDYLLDESGTASSSEAPQDFKSALAGFLTLASNNAAHPHPSAASSVPLHLVRLQPGVAPSLAARFKRRGGGGAAAMRRSASASGLGDDGLTALILRTCCRVRKTPSRAAQARMGEDDDDETANANDEYWYTTLDSEDEAESVTGQRASSSNHHAHLEGVDGQGTSVSATSVIEDVASAHATTTTRVLAFGGTGETESSGGADGAPRRRSSSVTAASLSIKPKKTKRRLKRFPVAFAPVLRDSIPLNAVDALVEAALRHVEARNASPPSQQQQLNRSENDGSSIPAAHYR